VAFIILAFIASLFAAFSIYRQSLLLDRGIRIAQGIELLAFAVQREHDGYR
jgi:hypothetical protein